MIRINDLKEADIRKYMNNIFKFYYFMTKSPKVNRKTKEYVQKLNEKELIWFYKQMKEPVNFIIDEHFLFYYLDIIISHDFKDLSCEFFLYYNIEMFCFDEIIDSKWMKLLSNRYKKELENALTPM